MSTTAQMFTITPLDTTLAAFRISADDLISVTGINADANSSISYQINNRTITQDFKITEAPSDIVTAAENLITVTSFATGNSIYVNASRIKKLFLSTAIGNTTGTGIVFNSESAAWATLQVTETPSAVEVLINAVADSSPIPIAQHITDTTQSTSVSTGALIVDGGVGIAKNIYVGGVANIAGQVSAAATTDSTTSTTGALVTAGGLGVVKAITGGSTITATTTVTATTGVISDSITELTSGKGITMKKNLVKQNTLTALNTTGTITAAIVNKGGITSTSAATVTATLDTASNIGTQISAVQGTMVDFIVDNSAGSNIVTVAVASGITAVTAVITGSDTLTVAAGAVGVFSLYFSGASTAKLSRKV